MASYEKNKKGKWSVRFRLKIDGVSVNKRLSGFDTKKLAEREYLKTFARYNLDTTSVKRDVKKLTLEQVINQFNDYHKNLVRQSTHINFKHNIKFLTPLYKKHFQNITTMDLQTILNSLTADKKQSTLKVFVRFIKQLFKFANNILELNNDCHTKIAIPLSQVPTNDKIRFLTKTQIYSLFDVCNNELVLIIIKILYFSGMRIGELLALTYNDFNFDTNIIDINKSYSTTTRQITATKNKGSVRVITMPLEIMEDIKNAYENGIIKIEIYKQISYSAFKHKYQKYQKLADFQTIYTIHELRHTHASMLLSNNIPITAISKRLGHSNVTQTLNTYSHVMPLDDEKINYAINNIL